MKRLTETGLFLMILLTSFCIYHSTRELFLPAADFRGEVNPMLILDAGHGGEDGGAVSINGIPESRINLEIVQKLDDLLGLYGEVPVLLRRTDVSLHDESAKTLRDKKISDLRNRAEIVQSTKGATLISIHQNTYPTGTVRGLQVFYAPTEGSEELARLIQHAVQETIQTENRREPKQIPESVYLMNHISCRAVLIECGFLSNIQEERELIDHIYQKKLAAVLACSWIQNREVPTECRTDVR